MKLKYFLRGLGTGIILTALILCISYRSGKSGEKSVVEQAKELGMVFPEGTQSPDELPEETWTPEETESPLATQKGTQPPATRKPGDKDKVSSSGAGVTGTEKSTPVPDTIKFKVRSGLLSSTVAREMKEAGIIEDDEKFDEYLEKNGYSLKIKEGTYRIPKEASYRDIAKIITGQD